MKRKSLIFVFLFLCSVRGASTSANNLQPTPEKCFPFDPATKTITGTYAFDDPDCGKNVVIPEQIGGVDVEVIGDNAFNGLAWTGYLESVVMPSTLKKIGKQAFPGQHNIHTLVLNEGLEEIGDGAFYVGTLIGNAMSCANNTDNIRGKLVFLQLPSTLKVILDSAFACQSLTSIKIPDSVISIGTGSFTDNQLTIVEIGNTVKLIGMKAFYNNKIRDLQIGENVEFIASSAFAYNQLINLELPTSVKIIGKSAFLRNQLTHITVPDSVRELGGAAFRYNKLTSITIGRGISELSNLLFANNQLREITIPDNIILIRPGALAYNQFDFIKLPASVSKILGNVFTGNVSNGALSDVLIYTPRTPVACNLGDVDCTDSQYDAMLKYNSTKCLASGCPSGQSPSYVRFLTPAPITLKNKETSYRYRRNSAEAKAFTWAAGHSAQYQDILEELGVEDNTPEVLTDTLSLKCEDNPYDPSRIGTYTTTCKVVDEYGTESEVITRTVRIYAPSDVGGSTSQPDHCPNGDTSGNQYDGKCEETTIIPTTGDKTPDPKPEEPKTEEKNEEPKKEEKTDSETPILTPEGALKYTDTQIYNPTIENGKCYNRRTYLGIKDSLKLTTSEEFKKALSFFRSYEMTMFDGVDGFDPYRNLTREEAAKIFSNFAINVLCRKPDLNLHTNYSDTANANETLKPYIELAYQLGIMKGSGQGNGNFRPKDAISKAEVNAVLIRMILKSYLDENQSVWYSEYNKVAAALGIITQGAGAGTVSRNDVALMLFRAYKNQVFDWRNVDYWTYVLESRETFVK